MTRSILVRLGGYVALPALALALSGCSGQTPAQTAAAVTNAATAAVTLAEIVAPANASVQGVLAQGALVCGLASTQKGQLLEGSTVAALNELGQPVTVTNAAASTVAGVCNAITAPQGVPMVPGPAAPGTTNLPTVVTPAAAALPAVALAATSTGGVLVH